MSVPLLDTMQGWECPSCDYTAVGRVGELHVHDCRGQAGLTLPMVPAGTKCVHVVHEREDYIGVEQVQYDGAGRPVMAVNTIRDDGTDATVFAPVAVVEGIVD
jgi:hypothetical protein